MAGGGRYGVEVRAAAAADAAELVRLLAQVGIRLAPADAAERLERMRARAEGAVLVTTGYAGLNGLVAVQWTPVLQAARPVAQITMLVVDGEERRRGIGRLLLKAAAQAARAGGCDRLDVAGGGADVAAFCRSAGFAERAGMHERSLRKRGGEG